MSEDPKLPADVVSQFASALIAGAQANSLPATRTGLMGRSVEDRRRVREQERLLEGFAKAMRGEQPFRTLGSSRQSLIPELQATIAKLTTDLECAKQKLAETDEALKRELLNHSSRSGIERVLISAIWGGYGVDLKTDDATRTVTSEIMDDGAKIGLTLDPKTVRKYVKEAVVRYNGGELGS